MNDKPSVDSLPDSVSKNLTKHEITDYYKRSRVDEHSGRLTQLLKKSREQNSKKPKLVKPPTPDEPDIESHPLPKR